MKRRKISDKWKIRKLQSEIKKLQKKVADQRSDYEWLWKMRIQDERERQQNLYQNFRNSPGRPSKTAGKKEEIEVFGI